jgi:hypothetical protein
MFSMVWLPLRRITPLTLPACVVGLALLSVSAAEVSLAQSDAKDIIAAQIRAQGYTCQNPTAATRDASASKPNEAVWVITCENATYRTTLIPNMAAKVEQLEQTDSGTGPE